MSTEINSTDAGNNEIHEPSVEKKSEQEAYVEALQSKKDVLDAFYQMNAFRKSKDPKDLSPEDRKNYDILKSIWTEKKQQNMGIVDQLDPVNLDKVLSFGMDVHAVGAELTLLKYQNEKSTDEASDTAPNISPTAPDILPVVPPSSPDTLPPVPVPRAPQATHPSILSWLRGAAPATPEPVLEPSAPLANHDVANAVQQTSSVDREPALTTERYQEKMKADKIANLKIELADIESKLVAERAKIYSSDIERRGQATEIKEFEDRKKEIEAEIELLEKGALGVFRDRVASAFHKTVEAIKGDPTKRTKWGWVKERLKGLATAGIWEVISAERVRGGGYSGADTLEASKNQVNVDKATTADGIEDYAWKLQREAKNKGQSLAGVDKLHEADNDLFIENQANTTVDDVMARVKKARGEAGQNIDTPENRAAIKAGVIAELTKIRQGGIAKTEAEMKKFIRDTLDEKWSRRYVYAGIEAALWAAGAASIIFRPEAMTLPKVLHPSLFGPDTLPIPTGMEDQYVGMSNTIWETVSKMFPGASDAVIMAKSKVLMAANHMFEPEWAAKVIGEISSRTLPQSFLLKLPVGFIG